jgi:hypothetical protein
MKKAAIVAYSTPFAGIGLFRSPARSRVVQTEIRCVGDENLTGDNVTRNPDRSTSAYRPC